MAYQPDPDDCAAWAGRSWPSKGLRTWQWSGDPLARDWIGGLLRFDHVAIDHGVPPTLMQLANRRTLREFAPEMQAVRDYLSTPRLSAARMAGTDPEAIREADERRRLQYERPAFVSPAFVSTPAEIADFEDDSVTVGLPGAVVSETVQSWHDGWEMVTAVYENGMTAVFPRIKKAPHEVLLESALERRDYQSHAHMIRTTLLQEKQQQQSGWKSPLAQAFARIRPDVAM